MSKKLVTLLEKKDIIGLCVMLAVIIALLLCLAPWPTRVNVEMDAVKLDQNGNRIGTATICIKGWKLDYLFRMDRMDITIEPFDNFKYFKLSNYSDGKKQINGAIHNCTDPDYYQIFVGGWNSQTNDMFHGALSFSKDLTRWMFQDNLGDGSYYVASVNADDSPTAIWEFFTS